MKFIHCCKRWLFIACWLPALLSAHELPDLGDPTAQTLSPVEEYRLGQSIMITLRHAMPLYQDILAETYINQLGERLQSSKTNNDIRFQFFLVNENNINAFALPGGFIGINTGLILATATEDQLASVMSHEMSHVTQRHIARLYVHQKQATIGAMAGAIAAVILATQNPQAGSGALMATIAGQAQSFLSFSRANEQEADRVGIQRLAEAGFDPLAMPQFFETLYQNSRFSGQYVPEYLQTHPLTQSRIADAKNRALQLTPKQLVRQSEDYWFVKARLKVKQFSTPRDALAFFKQPLVNAAPIMQIAHEYGLGLSLLANNRTIEAISLFQTLQEQAPRNLFFKIALAEAYLSHNQASEAIALLEKTLKTHAFSLPLVVTLADSYLMVGEPQKSIALLDRYQLHQGESPMILSLISRAYGQAGNATAMHYYQAKYLEHIGEYRSALDQLKLAQKSKPLTERMNLQIVAKIDEIKERIESDKKSLH